MIIIIFNTIKFDFTDIDNDKCDNNYFQFLNETWCDSDQSNNDVDMDNVFFPLTSWLMI